MDYTPSESSGSLSWQRDLRFQMLALYLMLVIPALAAIFIVGFFAGQQIQQDAEASDLSLARAVAQETSHCIETALNEVAQLGQYQGVRSANPAEMEAIFSIITAALTDVDMVYRLDENGNMLYYYPQTPADTVGVSFAYHEYFKRATDSTTPLISEARISPVTGEAVATAVMPLRDSSGKFIGIVATNIRLASLTNTLREIIVQHQPEEGFQIFIIDRTGRIIAHPEKKYLLQLATDLVPELYTFPLRGEAGNEIGPNQSGQPHLYSYAPIANIGWGVLVSRPTASAFWQQALYYRISFGAAILFILLGLIFWRVLSRQVILPIEKLATISRDIGISRQLDAEARKFLKKGTQRPDQIGDLINSLVQTETSITERMNAQTTLLETGQAVVSSLDTETVLNKILEQVERLIQVKKIAILSLNEEQGIFQTRANRGLSPNYAEQTFLEADEPSLTMQALRTGKPTYVNNIEKDPNGRLLRPLARQEGYRAALAVPLKTQHTPASALVVFHTEPHKFSKDEIQLLSSFGNYAVMALENAALYTRSDMRLQEQTHRLEALIHSMQDGLILSDPRGKVAYANRRFYELSGLSADIVCENNVWEVMTRLFARANEPEQLLQQAQTSWQEQRPLEIQLNQAGRILILRIQTFDVTDTAGVAIGQGILLKNITRDRALDRMKTSLIAAVSHELRTPLAAIKGYATTLLAEDVQWEPSSQRDFLNIISAETDHLSELVNNLLDLSRIEAGSLKLQQTECDLQAVIEQASSHSRLTPTNHLTIDLAPGLPTLIADPHRLETILRNLLENSVKYAGDTAQIHVSVSQAETNFIFQVEDDGPGIPPEENKHIFESYYRLENNLSRTVNGSGLGLAICQGFVQAHGGEIWVESGRPGMCIAFSIPIKTAEKTL